MFGQKHLASVRLELKTAERNRLREKENALTAKLVQAWQMFAGDAVHEHADHRHDHSQTQAHRLLQRGHRTR